VTDKRLIPLYRCQRGSGPGRRPWCSPWGRSRGCSGCWNKILIGFSKKI